MHSSRRELRAHTHNPGWEHRYLPLSLLLLSPPSLDATDPPTSSVALLFTSLATLISLDGTRTTLVFHSWRIRSLTGAIRSPPLKPVRVICGRRVFGWRRVLRGVDMQRSQPGGAVSRRHSAPRDTCVHIAKRHNTSNHTPIPQHPTHQHTTRRSGTQRAFGSESIVGTSASSCRMASAAVSARTHTASRAYP